MRRRKKLLTAPRKEPVQARSTQLVAAVLKAAVRVLAREGAERFTTIRIAEVAGVSVGSLYQYFPNKQAILYRLQVEEWEQTGQVIEALLGDASLRPEDRLRNTVHAFFRSECEEAPLRRALDVAAPDWHHAPESLAGRARAERVVQSFVGEIAPGATARQRRFAGQLVFTTITAVGKQLSEASPIEGEIDRWADSVTDMVMGHLRSLASGAGEKTPTVGRR
jgi:AcrR family transcriptional regulator